MCPAQLRAQHKRVSRARLHVASATRDHASGEGADVDVGSDRLSHIRPSDSVVAERAAAVEAAISHYVRACHKLGSQRVLSGQVWVRYHGRGAGVLATDGGDSAVMISDDLRAD